MEKWKNMKCVAAVSFFVLTLVIYKIVWTLKHSLLSFKCSIDWTLKRVSEVWLTMVCLTELQHLLDSEEDGVKSVTVTEKASLSLDHFWWRVGQGSHIQQAPHPPGKHVWGEALILDCLTLQVKSPCIYLVVVHYAGWTIFWNNDHLAAHDPFLNLFTGQL